MAKPILVIQGYHFGYMKHHKSHLWINTTKPYNFKVTYRTHNIRQCSRLNCCSVLTRKGKAYLVITKVIKARGLMAIKMARKLQPVIAFHNYGMNNSFLYKLLFSNTNTKSQKEYNLLHRLAKIKRSLHNHQTNRDVLHYAHSAQKALWNTYGKANPKENIITASKLIMKGNQLTSYLKQKLNHIDLIYKHPTKAQKENLKKEINKIQPNDIYIIEAKSNKIRLANARDLRAKLDSLTVNIKHGWHVHTLNMIGNQK